MELGSNYPALFVVGAGLLALIVSGGLFWTLRILKDELDRVQAKLQKISEAQIVQADSHKDKLDKISARLATAQQEISEALNSATGGLGDAISDLSTQQAQAKSELSNATGDVSKRLSILQEETSLALEESTANLSTQQTEARAELTRTFEKRHELLLGAINGVETGQETLRGELQTCAENVTSLSVLMDSQAQGIQGEISSFRDSFTAFNSNFDEEHAQLLAEFNGLQKNHAAVTERKNALDERLNESLNAANAVGARLETAELEREEFHEIGIRASQEVKDYTRRVAELTVSLEKTRRQMDAFRNKAAIAEQDRGEFEKIDSADKELLRSLLAETQNELVITVDRLSAIETESALVSPMFAIGDALKSILRAQDKMRTPATAFDGKVEPGSNIKPRNLIWTRELVDRFWNGVVQTRMNESSFMNTGGKSVMRLMQRFLPRKARIVDFGSGDGQLSENLLLAGYRCAVVEPAKLRSESTRKRLEKYDTFIGMLDDTSKDMEFDAVVMCEVIEHILDVELVSVLTQVASLLKPETGKLILTCPYDEDLELNSVLCPVTGLVYHRQQHVRSLRPESLAALLEPFGFRPEWVGTVNFRSDKTLKNWVAKVLPKNKPIPAAIQDGAMVSPSMVGPTNIFMVCSRQGIGANKSRRTRSRGKAHDKTPIALNEPVELKSPFTPMGGYAYFTNVNELRAISDSAEHQTISSIWMYEDGKRLGPAHSSHDDISGVGEGCFSHWGDCIYFAATDNSDPNFNNRKYTLRILPGLPD